MCLAGMRRVGEGRNVFTWLDEIRRRPAMFLGETSTPVDVIQTLLCGYYAALSVHGIVEPVPAMTHHFSSWLRLRTSWPMACGWAVAITDHCEGDRALPRFFDFVDEYRKLVPMTLATTKLNERHEP